MLVYACKFLGPPLAVNIMFHSSRLLRAAVAGVPQRPHVQSADGPCVIVQNIIVQKYYLLQQKAPVAWEWLRVGHECMYALCLDPFEVPAS